MKNHFLRGILPGLLLLSVLSVHAQCTDITGRVFTDFNENGIFDAPAEVGLADVSVSAFDNDNTLIAGTLTDAAGQYTLPVNTADATTLCPDGTHCYRVEFDLPADHVAWSADSGLGAEVQRICDNNCTADLASYCRYDYCEDNPTLTTPCYIDGPNNGTEDVLISFSFDNPTGMPMHESREDQIATTYGLAYHNVSDNLFAAAFQKRFSGYGAGSPGSIYIISEPKDNAYSGAEFLDLNTLFGTPVAGTDPHDFTTVSMDDPLRFVDAASFDAVGRMSLGDMEIAEDLGELYVINLTDRSLYTIPLGSDIENPTAPTSAAQITVTPLADAGNPLPDLPAGISNEEIIPFGLEVHKGLIYIGLVTNGQTNGLTAMHGLVYSYNPTTGVFAKALQYPLNYARGCGFGDTNSCYGPADWQPWLDANVYPAPVFSQFREEAYPQPILADLGFDNRGNMVVSMRDRWGDQGSYDAPKPDDDGTMSHYDAFGDILYAVTNNDGTWSLNIADFTDNTLSVGNSTAGAAAPCPDGENFFGSDCYNADTYIHEETNFSGIAIHLPSDQVTSISMDPEIDAFSTGVDWHDLSTGTQTDAYQILTLARANDAGEFGKGNGLGDLELMCAEAPIEIGNYVWLDTDRDGIQDPCESPLSGITVELYDAAGTLVGSAVTDNKGIYNFGGVGNVNMIGTNILDFGSDYELRLDVLAAETEALNSGQISTGLLLTQNAPAADRIDNDATLDALTNQAVIAFTTGRQGDNNHNYDFGFFDCSEISDPTPAAAVCSGDPVSGMAVSATNNSTEGIRFVYFSAPQTGEDMYTGGTDIAFVTADANNRAVAPDFTFPPNTGATNDTYYVYAVLNPTPSEAICRSFAEIEITIYPAVNVAPADGEVCLNETVIVNGNASDGSGAYPSHTWTDLGTGTAGGYTLGGTMTPALTLDATGANPGTVAVRYTVTDSNGCTAADDAQINIHGSPTANAAELIECENATASGTATFDLTDADATVTGGAVGTTVTYFEDAGLTNGIGAPTNFVSNTTIVYAQVTDGNGCTESSPVTLTVATVNPTLRLLTCYNNYTNGNENDDYYTARVNATATHPGASGSYEVVLNAAADGSGGTVIGTAMYGTEILIGAANELPAEGTDVVLTFRDADDAACRAIIMTGSLTECSDCPAQVCPPVSLQRFD